jgi:hypothetical protein
VLARLKQLLNARRKLGHRIYDVLPACHTVIVIDAGWRPPERDKAAEFLGCDGVEPVGHGEWSRAFCFTRGGRDLVARFSAIDDDFLKDQRVERIAPALPIPKVIQIGSAFGGYFAISERAYGSFIEERDLAGMKRLLPSLFAALDALREVDLTGTHGFGLWRGSDGQGLQATWRDTLLSFATRPPSTRQFEWQAAWSTLDIRQAAVAHFAAIGLPVPNFDARLRCYELAIGLDGLAYQAHAGGSADNLAWTAARLRHLLGT